MSAASPLWVIAGVVLVLALVAAPAQAAPISAHAMVHTCCTPDAMKERIFEEAEAVGAEFVRVDVEIGPIFEGPGGVERDEPSWKHLDEVLELAREHDVQVLGVLLASPAYISTCADPTRPGALPPTAASSAGSRARSPRTRRTRSITGRS
jgi:hypothetical protein